SHPRRNDMIRGDIYASAKLNAYFRWINDYDLAENPFSGYNFAYTSFAQTRPGHGYAGHITYTFSPTLLNEFTLGKSFNSVQTRPVDPTAVNRKLLGDLPQLFPNQPAPSLPSQVVDSQMMPSIAFGGTPVNTPAINIPNNQHVNHNDTWDIT